MARNCTLGTRIARALLAIGTLWSALFFQVPAHAQPAAQPPPETAPNRELPPTASFNDLTIDQGLADQIAPEITQDPEGFMWFGTFSGLDRYDGYRFVHYRHDDSDPHSLSGNVISALYADRAGNVWVGARGAGLDRFDPRTQLFEHFRNDPFDPSSLSSDSPHMVYQDRSGTVWVASEGGLSKFNSESGTFTNYRHDDSDPGSIASNAVRSIAEDASGGLWLGTAGGLSRFDPKTGRAAGYQHNDAVSGSLGSNGVWKVVVDHQGVVWSATDNGLDSLDPNGREFTHYRHIDADQHSLSTNPLDALLEDNAGRIWVGTFGGGVSVLDIARRSFTNYRHDPGDPSSLSYDQVDKILQDRSGLIWLGTGGGGVEIYNPQQQAVTIYRPTAGDPNSLASPFVYSVLQDASGFTWVGTRNAGLDRLDRQTGQVTHFPPEPQVPGRLGWPAIQDIQQDRTGALWLAAYGGGLYRFDPASGTFTVYRHDPNNPQSLSHDNVRKLSFDETGALWIATTGGGLDRLDPNTGVFTAYRANASDPRALANDLTVGLDADQHGGVWVGTAGSGLQRLDTITGQFMTYRHDPTNPASLSENNVFAIHVGRSGLVWVGTQGGGLDALDPSTGSFAHYHVQDGLPSERIQAIVEDGGPTDPTPGNLWILTDRGVARLDADQRTLRGFDTSNGLPRAQFTMGAFLDHQGQLLLASLTGLVVFDPAALRPDATPPPVVLTDLRLDNAPANRSILPQAIDVSDSVEISYAQRVVSFEFSALTYADPLQNRYRYKLEGFDGDWTEVDATRRVATYTNLEPGSYLFRVTASNADGVWNDTGKSINLIVAPPWWAMGWVRALAILSVVCALACAYLWRERALNLQRQRLEILVGERTRALESALVTRDVFLRGLAHDLKGPVANLSWHVQSLALRTRGETFDPQVVHDSVAAITASADAVAATIDELRDLARLAAGETLPLHCEILDLVELARSRVELPREIATERFQFRSAEPSLIVDADRARLARVIDNLLDNAAKYSPADRPIEVSLASESRNGRDCAVLSVRDHGIGIPAADLPHIFEQYHRAGNVGKVPGEGLGLASARQLVLLHGGALEVQSEEKLGSAFSIVLPIASGVITTGT